jgi:hypothetical protein
MKRFPAKRLDPNIIRLTDRVDERGRLMSANETLNLADNTLSYSDKDGQLVTMELGPADVHVDTIAANILVGYKNPKFIADLISPVIPKDKASGKFFVMDPGDEYQAAQGLGSTAPGGAVVEIQPRVSKTSYAVKQYACGTFVPTELEAQADSPLRPGVMASNRVMKVIALARELRVSKKLTTSTNWGSGQRITLDTSTKWNGGASSDPISNLLTGDQNSLSELTHAVMSRPVFNAFIQNASVREWTKYKANEPVLPSAIDGLYQFPNLPMKILVSDAKVKVADGSMQYIWGSNIVLLRVPATPMSTDGQEVSSCLTFRWNVNPEDGTVVDGLTVRSFFDERRGPNGGRSWVCSQHDAEKITDPTVGGIIVGAIQ